MSISKLKDRKGMSLLEVLVSMIILSLGVLGLAPMIVTSIEGNVISRDNTVAANLAKQKVEHYQGVDTLPTCPFEEHETGLNRAFSRSTYINDSSSDTLVPAGVCQIEVVVSWTDNQNLSQSTSYSTYIM